VTNKRWSRRVSNRKSDKELAFLHDLFIAPDWGERFAELVDEHVEVPKEGQAVYIASGAGGHALAIQERAGKKLALLSIDENEECLILARAKATATNEQVRFERGSVTELPLPHNKFDLVIGNASLVPPQKVRRMLSEMVRITAPGAQMAMTLPTASSFGEFFSIYWEALYNLGLLDLESDVETLITVLPTISDLERMARDEGLVEVSSWVRIEEFDYDSGELFLNSPLVSDFLMTQWLASVPEASRDRVAEEILRLINEERHEAEFALSVKATVMVGRKSNSH
jgi:ubiquinone/menaquinone biosynthesis C-methylase UbiE